MKVGLKEFFVVASARVCASAAVLLSPPAAVVPEVVAVAALVSATGVPLELPDTEILSAPNMACKGHETQ